MGNGPTCNLWEGEGGLCLLGARVVSEKEKEGAIALEKVLPWEASPSPRACSCHGPCSQAPQHGAHVLMCGLSNGALRA